MPARNHAGASDEIAYSVDCTFCGAKRGEPCVVMVPAPRSLKRLAAEPQIMPPGPEATFEERRRHRDQLPVRRTCDHAHAPRVAWARKWQSWHRGLAPREAESQIVGHGEAEVEGAHEYPAGHAG